MKIHEFLVRPNLPEKLKSLTDIAMNLWHCWNMEAVQLFMRLDEKLWEETNHNPVEMLGRISQVRLEELAEDDSFIAELGEVHRWLEFYMTRPTWFQKAHPGKKDTTIAYFSCEYGINETLPIYSGGLGILSGDHVKSSSDLGIPLVAIGLLYRHGYLRQYLNIDGWQQEEYPENDWFNMPVVLVRDESGERVKVQVELGKENLWLQVWRVQVGRVPLYLLCANLQENSPAQREITNQLYGGDREMRIRQEIVLGVGGVKVLKALGIAPDVFHINEGHSAFLLLERLHNLMTENGLSLDEAREVVKSSTVFTTHTPVPAGNERFKPELMKKYLSAFTQKLGVSWDEFMTLGREDPSDVKEDFCLTVLALKLSAYCNGVSLLHGEVSRGMWKRIWPDFPVSDVPIGSVTNGIHTHTWISHDMYELFERYLGPKFTEEPGELGIWERADRIPDVEFWRTHQRRRERLVFFARNRLNRQLKRRGALQAEIKGAFSVLNPAALTIGFARRFATYKRGTLLFEDLERLAKIIHNTERPVQIIFAGLAHPQDTPGKEIIKEIIHFTQDPMLRGHVMFIEDYDINVARYLVQGVDVWLNTPRRPLEASGTSGMKAAANGALNLSIPDGWWAEAYSPLVGWSIGSGESYDDEEEQDYVESQALYNILENDVIPLFFDRDSSGLPRGWIEMVKESLKRNASNFNTDRMVMEYTKRFYLPASDNLEKMSEDEFARTKLLSAWLSNVIDRWCNLRVINISTPDGRKTTVAKDYPVEAAINLGGLTPDDVFVELYFGELSGDGELIKPRVIAMVPAEDGDNSAYVFRAGIPCEYSGRVGFAVRILPRHEDLPHAYSPGLILWE